METALRVCSLYRTPYSEKFEGEYDYYPIINDFGDILFKVDEDNYYGDSYILYGNVFGDGKYGFLNFGWGSCSGCDALQACESWEEVQELYNSLKNDIIWFDNAKEAYDWFTAHDWEGEYTTPEKKKFIRISAIMLKTILLEKRKEERVYD